MSEAMDYDAIVIGAGVIGGAIGFELARRGRRTLNVDTLPAAGYGSTANSCAIVRFSYSTAPGVALAWEGMHYWRDWADYLEADDERGLIRFVQCGMAIMLTEDGGHGAATKPIWDELGVPHEVWTIEEFRRRAPVFDTGVFGPPSRPADAGFWDDASGQHVGALFCPDAGYIDDPQLSCHNLQRAAEAKGGEFRFNTKVVEITRDGRRVTGIVTEAGETITAPVVVNVAGPHSYLVNEMAGLAGTMTIGTRALRHEVHHVPGPDDWDYSTQGFNVADDDSGIYLRGQPGNHVLIGSADPACDPQVIVDPDDYDRTIDPDQWEAQVLRANRRIPSMGVPHEKKGIVDLYDLSDDWGPIYDRTDLDGFYVAIGTSGNQYKNAGSVGHLMAELIAAVEAGHDHDADPIVVTGRYTGWEIETGQFRRNRPINRNSSMSVHG